MTITEAFSTSSAVYALKCEKNSACGINCLISCKWASWISCGAKSIFQSDCAVRSADNMRSSGVQVLPATNTRPCPARNCSTSGIVRRCFGSSITRSKRVSPARPAWRMRIARSQSTESIFCVKKKRTFFSIPRKKPPYHLKNTCSSRKIAEIRNNGISRLFSSRK